MFGTMDGGARGVARVGWFKESWVQGALLLFLAFAPGYATAEIAMPEKPAGVDHADWESLQQAIRKAAAQQKNAAQQTKLAAGSSRGADGAVEDQGGWSVAVSGDTALVGALYDDVGTNIDQGSAYVFTRSATSWTLQAKLTAIDGAASDAFGTSVALSGDTALVGAHGDDIGVNEGQGSAYVFTRGGGVWTLQAKLTASDGARLDSFGHVALDGDTALVGAAGDDIGSNRDQGSVYVFTRSGSTWVQRAKLVASDGAWDDQFGGSLALDDDTAVVGASSDNVTQGSAYVFTRGVAEWTQQAKLVAADGRPGSRFGTSVALDGNTVVVGAPFQDVGSNFERGAAYVFVRNGLTWTSQIKLTAADGEAEDEFGWSVAVSGNTALVGARSDNVGDNSNQGSAYVFSRDGTSWAQQEKLVPANGGSLDWFGRAVALDGDTALIGAPLASVGTNSRQGHASVFVRVGATWTQRAQLNAGDGAEGDNFGFSVALDGDTALVGEPFRDVGTNFAQGSAYVFIRSGSTWALQATLTVAGGTEESYFGWSVALDGDIALVGAPQANDALGAVYVFARSGGTWTQQARLTAADAAARDFFGSSVALDGNTALVGAEAHDAGASADQGSAYVFVRSGAAWTQQAKLTAPDGAAGDFFGVSVDLHGDTALVGASGDDVGANGNQGSAHVFARTGAIWALQAKLTAADGAAGDRLGVSVALEGDTALVGADQDDVGANANQGSAYVFARGGSAWTLQAKLTAADGAADDEFGRSVALDGDTALIGAHLDGAGANTDQGSAYLFSRSGLTWVQQARLRAVDGAAEDRFGRSVALEGGIALVGADATDAPAPFGNPNEGAVYALSFVGGQFQRITFASPGAQTFGTATTLLATASSGLAVSFSSATPDVCSITTGGTLSFKTSGTCTINADQGGNSAFFDAPRVSQSFTVNAVVPGAPTIGTATAGNARALVTFTAPASTGGAPVTTYTVTANPGGLTATGASSPITVTGLTNGTAYTFTVRATNRVGTGPASVASNRATPTSTTPAPVLRADQVVLRQGSGEVRIDVLANDSIGPALLPSGVLSITSFPLRFTGTASVLAQGATGLSGDVIAFTPATGGSGRDSLRYRVCFGGAVPCVDSTVSISLIPLDVAATELNVDSDRGHRDIELSRLSSLPGARFDAHGLVAPVVVSPSLTVDSTPETPFDAGGAETTLRTFAASTSARAWRVFVDARSLSGGDVDVYLGLDSNANGQADSSEVACAAAMSSVAERCELVVSQAANAVATYWVLLHSRSGAQTARAELFEVPVDRPLVQRQLVATGPGAVAANAEFPMRLVWNDATLAPGQVRGGWLEVRSDANASLGWVPVRIERGAGAAVPFALQSGIDHGMGLAASAANEGLYIDVPPGLTRLEVTTTSASNVDLHLARVDTPAASSATPTVPTAPARNLAIASAVTPSGNESLTVDNPAAGRWYVTPVNATGATAELTVRATLTGTGPVLRPGGFYNPQRSGNGLFLYPAGSQWAGLWYTYLQDGTTTWYYLQGAAPGATGLWRGTIFRSAWNGSSNFLTPVGEATVTPRSTSAFTFSYMLDGETGSEAYENFGGGCPTFAGAPLNASGHWFDPAKAGSGYSVQLFPNYEFYTVFGYDAQGVPRYLIAERNGIGAATETLTLSQNTGACPLCTRTGNPVRSTVGTLTRTFGSGTLQWIQLRGTFTASVPGTWAAVDTVTPLGSLQGCAAN
ncbi:MAG: fibronectin type III domain-containing protein [Lysobacteraceae bacterium]